MSAIRDFHDINLKDPKPQSQVVKIVVPLLIALAVLGLLVWVGIMYPEQELAALRVSVAAEKENVANMQLQLDQLEALRKEIDVLYSQLGDRPIEEFFLDHVPVSVITGKIETARPRGISLNSLVINDGVVAIEAVAANTLYISQFIAQLRLDDTLLYLHLEIVSTRDNVIPEGLDDEQTYEESNFTLMLAYAVEPIVTADDESEVDGGE